MSAESQGRRDRMLYWICTGLLAAQMLVSAGMYLFNHEMVREAFMHLGYPTHIIYPLAAAKLLGLAAVLSGKSRFLKNLAYAGFFYNLLLAVLAHAAAGDGAETISPAVTLVMLAGSFHFDRKLRGAS